MSYANRKSSLDDWAEATVSEALNEASHLRAPVLHVAQEKVDWKLPLAVLDSPVQDAYFFCAGGKAILGMGVAKAFETTSPTETGRRTSPFLRGVSLTGDHSAIMTMGGWEFPPRRRARRNALWRDFPRSSWLVPSLTLRSDEKGTSLVLAVYAETSSRAEALKSEYLTMVAMIDDLASTPRRTDALPRLQSARDVPSRASWMSLARRAIDSISSGELRKLVLSRAISLTFHDRIPAATVLRRLMKSNPESTSFAVKRNRSVFLGATPEMLMSVRHGEAKVDCLAASSPRSRDQATDDRLGARLLSDLKSRREHELVVQAAVAALYHISSSVEVPDSPALKRLTAIQHLYTQVKATLADADEVWAAAIALWPNPAIAGAPKLKAMARIRELEGIDRGWYSGVVGVADPTLDQADFAVGIRSGVIKGRRALIYAGAGLVAGSEPKSEFEETGWKLRTMQSALGVDDPPGANGS